MSQLHRFLAELASLAKESCPDAEISISDRPLEEEDGSIEVIVPAEKFDKVEEVLHQRSHEIWMDEGYDIMTLVFEKERVESVRTHEVGDG